MHTLATDELQRQPGQLLEYADRGEIAVVTRDGEPLLLAVPLGRNGLDRPDVRIDLAVRLFDHEQIGLGVAARIAGVSMTEMMDELGRRCIPIFRTTAAKLEHELAAFVSLSHDAYQRLQGNEPGIRQLLDQPGVETVEFEPPRFGAGLFRVPDLD